MSAAGRARCGGTTGRPPRARLPLTMRCWKAVCFCFSRSRGLERLRTAKARRHTIHGDCETMPRCGRACHDASYVPTMGKSTCTTTPLQPADPHASPLCLSRAQAPMPAAACCSAYKYAGHAPVDTVLIDGVGALVVAPELVVRGIRLIVQGKVAPNLPLLAGGRSGPHAAVEGCGGFGWHDSRHGQARARCPLSAPPPPPECRGVPLLQL